MDPNKLDQFLKVIMQYYASATVRNAQSANKKLDVLSGLFIQIGFGICSLAALRLVGNFGVLPLTLSGVIASALSIVAGATQHIVDFKFYTRETDVSRYVSDAALRLYVNQTVENQQAMQSAVEKLSVESTGSSSLIPLTVQVTLLAVGAILIFVELAKVI